MQLTPRFKIVGEKAVGYRRGNRTKARRRNESGARKGQAVKAVGGSRRSGGKKKLFPVEKKNGWGGVLSVNRGTEQITLPELTLLFGGLSKEGWEERSI